MNKPVDEFGRPVKFVAGPYGHGRAEIRRHTHQKMRELKENKRKFNKSARTQRANRRMNRPSKLDAMNRGHMKIDALMQKIGVSLT